MEERERIVHLRLDGPAVNVLDSKLLGGLTRALEECAADESLAAVFLSGKGRCFSAGASVEEHKPDQAEAMLDALLDASVALAFLPVPVVALVHGPCLGGAMELISFADFVVADPEATFGQPEIKLAFFPPEACYQLPRLTGLQNAAYAILTGATLTAERALAMGLVQELRPQDQWEKAIQRFERLSAPVLRLAKQALIQGAGQIKIEALQDLKKLFLEKLYRLEDVSEGIRSFEEKRRPQWKHR